jgi:protein pelota
MSGYAGDNIKRGQFHTLQLEFGNPVYIQKDEWDSHDQDLLKSSTCDFKDVSAAAVVMHMGLAHVCLITRTMCPTLAKIEKSIPKKRAINNQDNSINKFYTSVAESLSSIPNTISCFIIASPAFVGSDFFDFLQKNYADKYKWLFPITRQMHASNGHKHALLEALSDGSLGNILNNSGLDIERKAMSDFLTLLNTNPYQVYYGLRDVSTIIRDHPGAISTLMVSDLLFKEVNPVKRKEYIALSDSVKQNGGQVLIFSSMNPFSEQLGQLTGIACILQYEITDLQNEIEFIALESYINTAMGISPLDYQHHHDQVYSYGSTMNTTIEDELDEFICTDWEVVVVDEGKSNKKNKKPTSGGDGLVPGDLLMQSSTATKSNKKDGLVPNQLLNAPSLNSQGCNISAKSSDKKGKKDGKDKKDKKDDKKEKKEKVSRIEPEDERFGNNGSRDEDLGDFF